MEGKLTNDKRATLRNMLVERGFGQRTEDIKKKGAALFDRYVVASWEGNYDAIARMPAALFDTGIQIELVCSGDNLVLQGAYPLPTPNKFESYLYNKTIERLHFDTDPTLGDEIRALYSEWNALGEERSSTKLEVTQVLNSVTTFKRLYEIWPELKTIVPQVEQAVDQPLAAHLPSLNKTLGLPADALA